MSANKPSPIESIRDRVKELESLLAESEKKLADQIAGDGFTYCAFCGHKTDVTSDEATRLIAEHIETCPSHPMRAVEADRDFFFTCLVKVADEVYLDNLEVDDVPVHPISEDMRARALAVVRKALAAQQGGDGVLTLKQLRQANVERCETAFKEAHDGLMGWNAAEWACALAGEVGEACNLIKKLRRGEDIDVSLIGDELADVLAYLDLLAARLDIDLEDAYVVKFNEVSDRVGSPVKLK